MTNEVQDIKNITGAGRQKRRLDKINLLFCTTGHIFDFITEGKQDKAF